MCLHAFPGQLGRVCHCDRLNCDFNWLLYVVVVFFVLSLSVHAYSCSVHMHCGISVVRPICACFCMFGPKLSSVCALLYQLGVSCLFVTYPRILWTSTCCLCCYRWVAVYHIWWQRWDSFRCIGSRNVDDNKIRIDIPSIENGR